MDNNEVETFRFLLENITFEALLAFDTVGFTLVTFPLEQPTKKYLLLELLAFKKKKRKLLNFTLIATEQVRN